jgi:hypothetical protein
MSSLRALPALLALACTPAAFAQNHLGNKPWNPQDQINFSAFRTGTNSQIQTQGMFDLPSEAEFQSYWARSTGQSPSTAPRGVDWNRQKIVAIHLGKRPTGGYSVMVTKVERQVSFAMITAVERKPLPGQYVSKAVTSPYVLLKVDRITVPFRLNVTEGRGGTIPGGNIIVTQPGTVIVNPNDFSQRHGEGLSDPRNAVNWSSYDAGQRSQIRQQGLFTLTNPGEWAQHWSRMTGRPAQEAPGGIDWNSQILLAVHLGTRSSGGFSVKVARVERDGALGIVRAIEETPVPGSIVTQALTSPYVIVKVPRGIAQFKLDLAKKERTNIRVIDGN